jgi:hypothetical protein
MRMSIALVLAAGCIGTVAPEPGGPDEQRPSEPAPAGPGACAAAPRAPGAFRLLTSTEYGNTIGALVAGLGAAAIAVDLPPVPPRKIGFANRIDAWELGADYSDVVIRNAGRAAAAIARVRGRLHPSCADPPAETDCVRALIATVGRAAWRRPPTPAEQARFAQRFTTLRAAWSFDASVTSLVEVMLSSPHAFHRPEIGDPIAGVPGARRLGPHEVAQALSYAVTQGPPDEALARAADAGLLREPADIEAQLARLVDEKKTIQGLTRFFVDLLAVDRVTLATKDAKAFPFFKGDVPALLLDSFTRSAAALVSSDGARFDDVVTGTTAFVRKEIEPMFQVANTGTTFAPMDAGPSRPGLFTHPAFLAAEADELNAKPVHRARFVLQGALCVALADPPVEASMAQPPADPNLSDREKLAIMTAPANCVGCHRMLNPLAHAFEAYDAVGRHRTQIGAQPIDPSGTLPLAGRELSFRDAPDLFRQVARDPAARVCFVAGWYGYVLGRDLQAGDDCSRAATLRAFEQQDGRIRALLRALFGSESFLTRQGV